MGRSKKPPPAPKVYPTRVSTETITPGGESAGRQARTSSQGAYGFGQSIAGGRRTLLSSMEDENKRRMLG